MSDKKYVEKTITYVMLHRMREETRVVPADENEYIDELIKSKWRVARVFSEKHEVKI